MPLVIIAGQLKEHQRMSKVAIHYSFIPMTSPANSSESFDISVHGSEESNVPGCGK